MNLDLPEGYADPESPWFVPEPLRPRYVVDADREMHAVRSSGTATTMDGGYRRTIEGYYAVPMTMVRQRWVDRHYAAVVADPGQHEAILIYFRDGGPDATAQQRWDSVMSVRPDRYFGPVPETYSAEDERIWVHMWRCSQAAQQIAAAETASADRARFDRSHRCVACQQVDQTMPRGGRKVHGAPIQCCEACSILLEAAAVQRISVQRIETADGGTTRGEAVKSYLDSMAVEQNGGTDLGAIVRAASG